MRGLVLFFHPPGLLHLSPAPVNLSTESVGLPGNTRNVQKLGEQTKTDILSILLPNVLLAIMFFATLPPRFIGRVTNNKMSG